MNEIEQLKEVHIEERNEEPRASMYCGENNTEELVFEDLKRRDEKVQAIVDDRELLDNELFEVLYPHLSSDKSKFDEFRTSITNRFNLVYSNWNHYLSYVLREDLWYRLITARNREIVTIDEQEKLRDLHIGIIGLSVGQATALDLSLSGVGSHFKLVDDDKLAASNLNRLQGGYTDIGTPKVYLAKREMLEKNPYTHIECWQERITKENMREFLEGLDYVVDAFDSIQTKITLRKVAKELGITVIMGTDFMDGAIMDVEESSDPIFLGTLSPEELDRIEQMDTIPSDEKNIIIPRLLGLKREDIPPRLARHLQLMAEGKIPWMSQLGLSSQLVGAFSVYIMKALERDDMQDLRRRTTFNLDEIFTHDDNDKQHLEVQKISSLIRHSAQGNNLCNTDY